MNPISFEIKNHLSVNEKVLWCGQPKQGLLIRAADGFMIPFSLVWGGFAIFWEVSVLRSNAPIFFALFGLPFVVIGLYIIIGRFFFDAKHRAGTFYAVTNERILIVSGVFTREAKSLNLRTLSDLSITEGKNNEGAISFGGGLPFSSMFGGFASWPGIGQKLVPRFELVPDAKQVFTIIREAQRGQYHILPAEDALL